MTEYRNTELARKACLAILAVQRDLASRRYSAAKKAHGASKRLKIERQRLNARALYLMSGGDPFLKDWARHG